ncbi:MAG: branched-chain amino acid transport system permease protein [Anaerolineaceae bacterium]|nr:MAG: branched-chain amino acid transport system permease protein [Anaerolineaceae bacterium]
MQNKYTDWKQALRSGLLGGAIIVLLSLIGIVTAFNKTFIITKVLTFGELLLLGPIIVFSFVAIRKAATKSPGFLLLTGAIAGLASGLVLIALVGVGQLINLRAMFVNASDDLYAIYSYNQTLFFGMILRLAVSGLTGLMTAGFFRLPARIKQALGQALLYIIMMGLMSKLIGTVIASWGFVSLLFEWMFARSGLSIVGAVVIFLLVGGLTYWRYGRPKARLVRDPKKQQLVRWGTLGGLGILILLLPSILGMWFSEILDNVGLFILMGLGLNIVVGFAGLLDLGYVAFYAIGAYTIGVLTSPELGFFNMTFWQAFPFAILVAVAAGILLGLPILKMRGDYLAIVTLGFGEIIRLLALSDWLKPWLGGTQGIQRIAKPVIGIGNFSIQLESQQQLYYLILAGIVIVAFIAIRLRDSRLGRTWMALREDEDVAVAMGINHVATKLTAFAMGAIFSGIGGTIFAAKLGSIYPSSFMFLVSINILSLIIVGGMGSIPGVFVGALALMGLPEVLREFAEYRYLFYGAALVAMMLAKPEGLWPEARHKLELHEAEAPPPQESEPAATSA